MKKISNFGNHGVVAYVMATFGASGGGLRGRRGLGAKKKKNKKKKGKKKRRRSHSPLPVLVCVTEPVFHLA